MKIGFLRYGDNTFELEEAKISSYYHEKGDCFLWDIEIYPEGEENYIMLNSIDLNSSIFLEQIKTLELRLTAESSDLYEHTVMVDGENDLIESLNLIVKELDEKNQLIQLFGKGFIGKLDYEFKANCSFQGVEILGKNEEEINNIIKKKISIPIEKLEITWFETEWGKGCNIKRT